MYEKISCYFGLFIWVKVIKGKDQKEGTVMNNTYVFPAILKTTEGKKEIFLPQFSKTIEVKSRDTVEKMVETVKEFLGTKFAELIAERKEIPESATISNLSLGEGESLLFVEVSKPKKPYRMADRVRHMRQISGC